MIAVRRVDSVHAKDARLPNEPFELWGRLVPALSDGRWTWREEPLSRPRTLCFPDEPYDVEADGMTFLGAYDGATCVGLAVLRADRFRYLYLDDLKVCRAWRRRGVGAQLIAACLREARDRGMRGVYAVCQDDNLSAARFYLKQGFEIGGFDNRGYRGTSQQDKADIYFYLDCPEDA